MIKKKPEELFQFLKHVELFKHISEEHIKLLVKPLQLRKYNQGENIIEEGQEGKSPYKEDIESALQEVAEDPEDPYTYLDLAVLYLDAGQRLKAEEAFLNGRLLAGEDPEYFVLAGDMLSAREYWLMALEQYLQALSRSSWAG